MQFYFKEDNPHIKHLYYVATDDQFTCIKNCHYKQFSHRYFTTKFFCPVLNLEYAQRISKEAINWTTTHTKALHIMRFIMCTSDINKYIRGNIDNPNTFIVVPRSELALFNSKIVGYIERFLIYNSNDV